MARRLSGIAVLLVLVAAVPVARAEEWPPPNHERFVVYWTGTCGVSKSYNGHFEVDCWGDDYYMGTRAGKWRHTSDTDCSLLYVDYEKFEVCTSGSSCTANSGTWQEITYQEFVNEYGP